MATKADREQQQRKQLWDDHGIIDHTPRFRPNQAGTLLRLISEEKERVSKTYDSANRASLAMHLVDLDQLAKKVQYHAI